MSIKRRLSAAKHFAKRHSRTALKVGALAATGALAFYGRKHAHAYANDYARKHGDFRKLN